MMIVLGFILWLLMNVGSSLVLIGVTVAMINLGSVLSSAEKVVLMIVSFLCGWSWYHFFQTFSIGLSV